MRLTPAFLGSVFLAFHSGTVHACPREKPHALATLKDRLPAKQLTYLPRSCDSAGFRHLEKNDHKRQNRFMALIHDRCTKPGSQARLHGCETSLMGLHVPPASTICASHHTVCARGCSLSQRVTDRPLADTKTGTMPHPKRSRMPEQRADALSSQPVFPDKTRK